MRQKLSLPMEDRGPRPLEAAAAAQSVTAAELREFVHMCAHRYEVKRMEPGAQDSCSRKRCLVNSRIWLSN